MTHPIKSLREALRDTFFHCTGDLGDESVKKVER